jgi:hypothetical protein
MGHCVKSAHPVADDVRTLVARDRPTAATVPRLLGRDGEKSEQAHHLADVPDWLERTAEILRDAEAQA